MKNSDMGGAMRQTIKNHTYDKERALYNLQNADIISCRFAGPADGESVLKEAGDISVIDCDFSLRYPLWHVRQFTLEHSRMDEKTRAAIWYARDGEIRDSVLNGIKCLRECDRITMEHITSVSPEFGWKCRGLSIRDSFVESEYLFLESRDVTLQNFKMKGKYSFQYMDGLLIEDSELNTKDAFWHSRNVVVKNSIVKGEYLGWFSDGLTLIGCEISGTQPLCYCKNLKLIDCKMAGADLSFEYSDVEATVIGHIDSVKNPRSGTVKADSFGEIIFEDATMECTGKVMIRDA